MARPDCRPGLLRAAQRGLTLLWLAAWVLGGCGRATPPAGMAAATASHTPLATLLAATPSSSPAAQPTATPVPSGTPVSSGTLVPSGTPTARPTLIPSLTPTPRPSATPAPSNTPTATPTPQPPTPAPLVTGEALDLSLGWRLDANGHLSTDAVSGAAAGTEQARSYLGSLGRTVYAVDARGQVAWQQKTPGPVYALAPLPGGQVAVGDDSGAVTLLDRAGRRLWRVDLGTRVTALAAAPAGTGGLFAAGWDARLTRLDDGGVTAWQADAGGPVTAITLLPPPLDQVALATLTGQVRAYDQAGRPAWQLELGSPVAALGVLPVDGGWLLLAGVQDGRLVAIDGGGAQRWVTRLGGGAPVWQVAEMPAGTWSIVAGSAAPQPSLWHLSAAGQALWRVSMPANVTAMAVHALDRPTTSGADGSPEIVVGLASGQVIVCDAQGRQRAAVHTGLPVWGLTVAPGGWLLARADVAAWQIRAAPGPTGGPWLKGPALAALEHDGAAAGPSAPPAGEGTDGARATLFFLGDVAPGRSMEAQLLRLGPEYPWLGLAPLWGARDSGARDSALVVNLESVLSTRGQALVKPYLIRAHPLMGQMLAAGGVDVVTLANNHILDYGPEGLDETLATLDSLGIGVVGAGADREAAHGPARLALNGVDVAILGYAAARWDGSPDVPHTDRIAWGTVAQVTADVSAVAPTADLVVVILHAGTEYAARPSPDQVAVARAAIDAGAALVVGHHPHVTQTVERYGQGLIVYSLGDAILDIPRQAAMRGHLLRVQVGSEPGRAGYQILTAELWPFWIDAAIQPRLIQDGDAGAEAPLEGVLRRVIYP